MNTLKYVVRTALGLPTWYYTPRRQPVAATHLPVFMRLAQLIKIRRVLECGAGLFSTISFLNRDLFPDMERLVSFETSMEWKTRVESAASGDFRLEIRISDDIARDIASIDLRDWDVVFIDSGPTWVERHAVIRTLTPRLPQGTLMVVHDIEVDAYRKAASPLHRDYISKGMSPFTGIFTAAGMDSGVRKALRKWNKTLQREASAIPPNDVERWIKIAR